MLRSLDIRDVLIIDRLQLEFHQGLNVLTGETGAGKSILLDALGLVLGWRGRADLVRQGAEKGEVSAVFDLIPDHPVRAVLADLGIEAEGELILRRTSHSDGRKAGFVNDRRVSGEVLRDLSDHLVELHGQQDDRGLLDPKGHRRLLDDFGQIDLSQLRAAWAARGSAKRALAEAELALARASADEDYLRHAVAELDKLDPQPGEERTLDTRRRAMQAAEKIRADITRAHGALSDGAPVLMRDALRWLEGVADRAEGQLDGAIAALNRVFIELSEAEAGVEAALRGLDFNPGDLEAAEERLFAIRALARKYGVLADDLGGHAEKLRERLSAIDGGAGNISKLAQVLSEADVAFQVLATAITSQRQTAAKRLDTAMAGELAPLKMERAVFRTAVTAGDAGPEGQDLVVFTVATNPGAPSGPLNKIASGGELSRFLLALKVCLTGGNKGLTLIFDEIDRGVGGATADAVGRRLAALAAEGQVLVVTHSPQVAALGGHHWRVEKSVTNGATLSRVVPLNSADRIEEIARMLAGDRVTDAARDAARALLGEKSDVQS